MRVVICGGGVIGACTAHFLARRGVDVTLVERTEVACAASGKAGGFLALDWCADSPLDALARRSFALHAELTCRTEATPRSSRGAGKGLLRSGAWNRLPGIDFSSIVFWRFDHGATRSQSHI